MFTVHRGEGKSKITCWKNTINTRQQERMRKV